MAGYLEYDRIRTGSMSVNSSRRDGPRGHIAKFDVQVQAVTTARNDFKIRFAGKQGALNNYAAISMYAVDNSDSCCVSVVEIKRLECGVVVQKDAYPDKCFLTCSIVSAGRSDATRGNLPAA
ncbi:hypothetical protein EDD22DRAFT_852775 [Suillus occidentalis]|nr:hypothetical protein EDD22DRAFT_852775 [Suillus occidentalis]